MPGIEEAAVPDIKELDRLDIELRQTLIRMARHFVASGMTSDQFRKTLAFAIRHRIVTAKDLVEGIKVDKTRISYWTNPNGGAPNIPTRITVLNFTADRAEQQLEQLI